MDFLKVLRTVRRVEVLPSAKIPNSGIEVAYMNKASLLGLVSSSYSASVVLPASRGK